ncbi:MAG: RHS repeat protein [Actinobacteria bacterium]|nr:MAG: RHS repeat protein [Actinomycetota bacterium]
MSIPARALWPSDFSLHCPPRASRHQRGTECSSPVFPARRRLVVTLLTCLSLVAVLLQQAVPASAEGLPEIETAHMAEIEEWAYRNSDLTSPPVGCGTVCMNLWNAERTSVPSSVGGLWDALGYMEVELGLWSSLKEFAKEFGSAAKIGAPPFRVGWHIGRGTTEGGKWMEVIGPTAPPGEPAECHGIEPWETRMIPTGEEVGTSFFTPATSPGNEWYLHVCSSDIVASWAPHDNPEQPQATCGEGAPGSEISGWTKQEWHWNTCYEGLNKGVEVFAETHAQAFHRPFHFAPVHDWEGQLLTGEYQRGIQTLGGSDPGTAAVKTGLEHRLEASTPLREWVQWILESQHGRNPLLAVPGEEYGAGSATDPNRVKCMSKKPVNCATGNEVESQQDLLVGGLGPGLSLTRTYNAQLAAEQTSPGIFGYGWTGSYTAHLTLSEGGTIANVYQDDGSVARFQLSGETWNPIDPLDQARLTKEASNYAFTLPNQTVLHFNSSGVLTSETDRNGNSLTMTYSGEGRLESVTDPASRKLVFAYNGEGRVESVKDPMGHVVKYGYESGQLASVTEPGETEPRWQFKYDASHRLTTMTDGRGGKTTIEYDSSNRVTKETDPLERSTSFEYEPSRTKVTNKATGAVTDEHFSVDNEPTSITRGFGTASATTEEFGYDTAGNQASVIDGNKHTTKYVYDSEGNRTSMVDAAEHETKWGYDTKHDVISITTPKGETTTIKRDSHGNPELIERPAPAGKTQVTKEKYNAAGELDSVTDPLEHITKYEYNTQGDRTADIDPEGDKRTWTYDEDSLETSSVSPRGNVEGAEASKYTTKIERDAQGRPIKITDPLSHETKYAYDGNGNLESLTDPLGHKTKYTCDADNERTKVEEPNATITETGYDGAGRVTSQTDGNKHTTKYVRNILEQVIEIIDPLERKTTKEYDKAGNLTKLTDPAKRTTTNTYYANNLLKETTYSDGKTHLVKYEYDADNERTSMVDGTGTTSDTYDQLDRLTEAKDGHGNVVKYEYDLANELTKITYPNGKAVTRVFDKAGRLEKVTDWSEHTTKFVYNPDSYQTATTFPTGTTDEDKYTYNEADQLTEVKMLKGAESLASLVYTRDNDGQVKTITSKGLPGEEKPAVEYDANNRLTKGGTVAYEYDAGDNPTKTGSSTNTYDAADELKTGTGVTYSYDELGERTKKTPSTAATTYGYDQAGNLISVERPKEGKVAEIKDKYAYDGAGLRLSQTIGATTTFLAWQTSESLPLILNDGTNSYIYGLEGVPIEQVSSGGTVLYLHHDQQGSTRVLTGSTGKSEATFTYDAYGNTTGTTGTATTPLGYDAQYTSSDTGLIYLRARVYDPATAQFMRVDPLGAATREPYTYAGDNPPRYLDRTGLGFEVELPEGVPCSWPCVPPAVHEGFEEALNGAKEGFEAVVHVIAGSEEANDEGEQELKERQAEEAECENRSGDQLRRESEQILGRGHNPARIKQWQEWWKDVSAQERKDFHKAGGRTPRKRT